MDKNRLAVKGMFCAASKLVWNGREIAGLDPISDFLCTEIPLMQHDVRVINAHEIPSTTGQGRMMHAVCSGDVSYGSDKERPFQQSFLFAEVQGVWFIVRTEFRLLN